MRWAPVHPRDLLAAVGAALLLALVLLLAAGPDLSTLDFSLGGSSGADETSVPAPAPAAEPSWLRDPLASPLEALTR